MLGTEPVSATKSNKYFKLLSHLSSLSIATLVLKGRTDRQGLGKAFQEEDRAWEGVEA